MVDQFGRWHSAAMVTDRDGSIGRRSSAQGVDARISQPCGRRASRREDVLALSVE